MRLKFIYSFILSVSLISTNILSDAPMPPTSPSSGYEGHGEISQEEADLMKLTEDLMSAMTPEQRKEVDDELAKFMSLSEEEQGKYLESKFQELSAGLEEAEALSVSAEASPDTQNIEPVQEKKEVKRFKAEQTKIEQVNEALKKLIKHIEPLLIKARVLPQVSKNSKIAQDWINLSDSLIELNSFAKIISPKDNLVDLLAGEEFVMLRKQLIDVANNLEQNESMLEVPDTAGLTISYEDEDSEAAETITNAQEQFDEFIPELKSLIEDEQVLWGLKRLLQKYTPEELKKVEAEKKAEKKYIAEFTPGKETPYTPSPKYNEPFFPYYGQGAGYNPTPSTPSEQQPGLTGSDKSKGKGGKGGGAKSGEQDKPGKADKEVTEKGKKEDKEKDKDKDKSKTGPDTKSLNELQTALDNITKIAKESNILNLVEEKTEKIIVPDIAESDSQEPSQVYGPKSEVLEDTGAFGPKTKEQVEKESFDSQKLAQDREAQKPLDINSRELMPVFTQININYTKASKALTKFNSSIKSQPDEAKNIFKMQVKNILENPELKKVNKAYNIVLDYLQKNTKRGSMLDDALIKNVNDAIKGQKELKELLEDKKPQETPEKNK